MTKFIYEYDPENANQLIKKRLPRLLFRDYLRDVLHKLPFPIEENKVAQLSKEGKHFISRLENGEQITSEAVVVATGIAHHKRIPENLAASKHPGIIHSWYVQDYEQLKKKKILIVGRGQSAADCVQHLLEENDLTWVMRKPPVFYTEPINLPKPIYKSILSLSPYFYFLPAAIKRRLGRKFVETTITPDMKKVFDDPRLRVLYEDVNELGMEVREGQLYSVKLDQMFDRIITATGYIHDVKNLPFLDEELKQRLEGKSGYPEINFNFETCIQNLYIVGGMVESNYGPAQRFMMGSRHVTLRLGRVLQS